MNNLWRLQPAQYADVWWDEVGIGRSDYLVVDAEETTLLNHIRCGQAARTSRRPANSAEAAIRSAGFVYEFTARNP